MRKNKLNLYQLESQNLSSQNLNTTNWVKYFTTVESAKRYAEKNYKIQIESPEKIEWHKEEGEPFWFTQDLGFVIYIIEKIEVEKE